MLHLIVFSVFGLVCVAGAINLLVQRHPINSALSLVVVMGSLAVEYLLLGAEFVAAVQVIVYAGAIMVLFVFVAIVCAFVPEASHLVHVSRFYVSCTPGHRHRVSFHDKVGFKCAIDNFTHGQANAIQTGAPVPN